MREVVVVGSGIAGLIAALQLSRGFRVTLLTKAALAESNTRWAQGGIAAAMSSEDSVAAHEADTLRAGAGLCNAHAVGVLCEEGPGRILGLIDLGVGFDRRDGELARGLEAAHSHARVLHAGGDATGLSIELALVRAVRAAANIRVLEHTFVADLLQDSGSVDGVTFLADGSSTVQTLRASAVVLASGGAGQLYAYTTNPAVATGDGVAMALRAGAEAENLEFYQFHPTALAMPGTFLISEAVRGEGALLRDCDGHRFMLDAHPLGELAPRDVVARGIARQMARQGGEPVVLDATTLGEAFLQSRFPTIDAACRRFGLDWARQPIPVTPAAHYWMGGIRTDDVARTSLPGLYAVGEVACTGVHGANRLASNSLLESLVFAWRCAEHVLATNAESSPWPALPKGFAGLATTLADPEGQATTLASRDALKHILWDAAGIKRTGSALRNAAAQLRCWHGEHTTIAGRETANLLLLARAVVSSALARQESRGAHFRSDFPEADDAFAFPSTLQNSSSRGTVV